MSHEHAGGPTAYDWLGVHANAPGELISASYWLTAGALQQMRSAGERIDEALFTLTRAYEILADPKRRAEYDAAVGHYDKPLTIRSLPRVRRTLRGRIFGRPQDYGAFDFYEVLGVSPDAPQEMLPEAWHIMRDHYLRLPQDSKRRKVLLEALDAAYQTLSSPESRARYDARARSRLPLAANRLPATGTSEAEAAEPLVDLPKTDIPVALEMEAPPDLTTESAASPQYEAAVEGVTEVEDASPPPEELAGETQGPIVIEHEPALPAAPTDVHDVLAEDVTPSPVQSVPDSPSGSMGTFPVTSSAGSADDSRRPFGEVLAGLGQGTARAVGRGVAAAAWLLGRGIRGVWRATSAAWSMYRERRSRAKAPGPPPPVQPPISAGSRLTRIPHAQVEEALLGRLANYMKEHEPKEPESSKSRSRGSR